jgi:hypothetical protein
LVFVTSVVASHVHAQLNAKTLDGVDLFTSRSDGGAVDDWLKRRSASRIPDFKIGSPEAVL